MALVPEKCQNCAAWTAILASGWGGCETVDDWRHRDASCLEFKRRGCETHGKPDCTAQGCQ